MTLQKEVGATLDFVIGGVPRGGTTFFSLLLNGHPDVYSYFMETGLFRYANMLANEHPIPSENIPKIRDWLKEEFRHQLVGGSKPKVVNKFRRLQHYFDELEKYGLSEPSGPGLRVFDEQKMLSFLDGFLELLNNQYYGRELLLRSSALIRTYMSGVTERKVIGEKTPDNIYIFNDLCEADTNLKTIAIVREPYTTLRSFTARSNKSNRLSDLIFPTKINLAIGEYLKCIQTISELKHSTPDNSFYSYRYEDLLQDPGPIVADFHKNIGLAYNENALAFAQKIVSPFPSKKISDSFDNNQIYLIRKILGSQMREYGYNQEHYDEDIFSLKTDMQCAKPTVMPLYGLTEMQSSDDYEFTSGFSSVDSSFFLIFPSSIKNINIGISLTEPKKMLGMSVSIKIECNDINVADTVLSSDEGLRNISVNIDDINVDNFGKNALCCILKFTAGSSFRPVQHKGMGLDMRDFAFMINSIVLV